ncbi:MAG: iron chelate uptake ABC transporter family permease subunit, partial [Amphiplicatus sp.]
MRLIKGFALSERAGVALLIVISALIVLLSCLFGPADIDAPSALAGLFGAGDAAYVTIAQEIRLPRALAAWIAGAALGASGAALQGLLRNPLADPGVLGVSAAAALGAV